MINICHAGMYFPKQYVQNPQERPGAMNFMDKKSCEAHYSLPCVQLPDDYDPSYHVYAANEFATDHVKKKNHDDKKLADRQKKDADKIEIKRIKGELEAGNINEADTKKLLKYLLKDQE